MYAQYKNNGKFLYFWPNVMFRTKYITTVLFLLIGMVFYFNFNYMENHSTHKKKL